MSNRAVFPSNSALNRSLLAETASLALMEKTVTESTKPSLSGDLQGGFPFVVDASGAETETNLGKPYPPGVHGVNGANGGDDGPNSSGLKRKRHRKWKPHMRVTDDELEYLRNELDSWTIKQTGERGKFFLTEAVEEVARLRRTSVMYPYQKLATELLGRLPGVVSNGRNKGFARTGVHLRSQTLGTLVAFARTCIDEEHTPTAGRRDTQELTVINNGQFSGIVRAACLLAEMITGDSKCLDEVTEEHFEWVHGAGENGRGEWGLVARLRVYSDSTAEARHRNHHGEDVRWDSRLNNDRRKKHEQGVRNLLNLAATHNLIPRGDNARRTVIHHAPDWEPDIRRLRTYLEGKLHPRILKNGLYRLALYATRLGYFTAEETCWSRVIDTICAETMGVRRGAAYSRMQTARRVYRELLAGGVLNPDPARERRSG